MTSRRATVADAPVVSRIAEQAYEPYVARMGGTRPAPMDADYATLIVDGEGWIVEDDGGVIGFLVLVVESDGMHVEAVAVAPAHQGTGAGRHLLQLAESRARAAGYDHLRLYTNEAMVESQALYERNGYLETHRAQEHGFKRVFYVKELTADRRR